MIFHVSVGSDSFAFDLPQPPLVGDQIETRDGSLIVLVNRRWLPPESLDGDYYPQYYGNWVTRTGRVDVRFDPGWASRIPKAKRGGA